MKGVSFPPLGVFLLELLVDNQWVTAVGRHHRGAEMTRRLHERDAATDPESSERDVRFEPDAVFRMRGSFRGPPGDSGPRARPTTALATLQSNREAGPARTGRGSGKEYTVSCLWVRRSWILNVRRADF